MALIVGPPDTPYQYGMFEFLMELEKDYRTKKPEVTALTTDNGRTRFNPNVNSGTMTDIELDLRDRQSLSVCTGVTLLTTMSVCKL
ncbi:hypothetical protein V1512DRAFT_249417 [Lipomyces arxii]|uniref:uncharacterized protein n=1 Tax=Lipomyces arxii TaxID=56418 RepID=UPI0034CEBE1B